MTLDDVGLDDEGAALKERAELIATEVLAAIDHALKIALRAVGSAQTWTVEDNPGRRLALIETLLGLEAETLARWDKAPRRASKWMNDSRRQLHGGGGMSARNCRRLSGP